MASNEDTEETSQVVGYPTDGQRKNVKIINILNLFLNHIETVSKDQAHYGNTEGSELILASLKDIDKLSRSVIEPLMESIKDAIEAIILTMHNETHFANDDETIVTKISPYLRELKNFLHRACNDFLQPFQCENLVSKCSLPLTVKTVQVFIQHASMIRYVCSFNVDDNMLL